VIGAVQQIQKMRKWSEDTLMKEIEWFSANKIPYIDCCDANFGIFQERDYKLAVKLKEECLKTGYPERVRPAWAKFSSEKIIPIAKELKSAGLLRAVTLALQSLDETTLDIVKRENIKFDEFSELTKIFLENGIPTYTELIMGLPGETLESWKNGLEIIASDTRIGSIYVYNCGVFANAPMNEPSYVKLHEIKKLRSPIYLAHSSIHERGMPEYEDLAIGAKSFTLGDLKQINLYSWTIQVFHSFGIFEYLSKYYHKKYDMQYMEFYDLFLDYCKIKNSIFSIEYKKVTEHIDRGYSGNGWNHYDTSLGEINWPIEEASWLRLVSDKNKLIDEISLFLVYIENIREFNTSNDVLDDLIKFQVFLLTTKNSLEKTKSENFHFDWKSFFMDSNELKSAPKKYFYENLITEKDSIQWAYKTIWYGRSSIKYKFHPEDLQEEEFKAEMPQIAPQSKV